MSSQPPDDRSTPFRRPWEDSTGEHDDAPADDRPADADEPVEDGPSTVDPAVSTPALSDPVDESDTAPATDLSDLESGETSLDHFSSEDYLATTTREYQGLAEQIAQADSEEFERTAVAASIPGVGSGLITFDDVTGKTSPTEEEMEIEDQQRASDLTLRFGTAVVLLGLFLGSLFMGGAWFATFVGIVMVVALGEFYATVRTRGYVPVALFGFIGLIGSIVGSYVSGPAAIGGFTALTLTATGFFYSIVVRRDPLENASITVFGMAWVALLSFAVIIGRSENSVAWILLVVGVTAVFDMGSYFVGRTFGRRLIAPVVSPKKTVEGLVGGVVLAVGLSTLLSTIIEPLDLGASLGLAAIVCILAPLGDAAESVVKRALDVKDMGSILPGHGGMLDRVDALLFVVPAAYFYFDLLGYL